MRYKLISKLHFFYAIVLASVSTGIAAVIWSGITIISGYNPTGDSIYKLVSPNNYQDVKWRIFKELSFLLLAAPPLAFVPVLVSSFIGLFFFLPKGLVKLKHSLIFAGVAVFMAFVIVAMFENLEIVPFAFIFCWVMICALMAAATFWFVGVRNNVKAV